MHTGGEEFGRIFGSLTVFARFPLVMDFLSKCDFQLSCFFLTRVDPFVFLLIIVFLLRTYKLNLLAEHHN